MSNTENFEAFDLEEEYYEDEAPVGGFDLEDESEAGDGFDIEDVMLSEQLQDDTSASKLSTTPVSEVKTVTSFIKDAILGLGNPHINQDNVHLVTGSAFSDETDRKFAEQLRTILYTNSLEQTLKFYRVTELNLMNEKIKRLDSHMLSVATGFKEEETKLMLKLGEVATSIQALQTEYNSIRGTNKEDNLSHTHLQERLRALNAHNSHVITTKMELNLKHNLVLDFLRGIRNIYADPNFINDYINYKYRSVDLMSDIEINGTTVTAKCESCGKQVEFSDSKLPKLHTGRLTYKIDILAMINEIYEVLDYAQKFVVSRCLYILKSGAVASNNQSLLEQAGKIEDFNDRLDFLYRQEVVSAIPNQQERVLLTNTLYKMAKSDKRIPLYQVLLQLRLNPNPVSPNIAKHFPTIKNPTVLNILRNRHPLLVHSEGIDPINQHSGGDLIAKYMEFYQGNDPKANEKCAQWIYSELKNCFQYPVPTMVYSTKMGNISPLPLKSLIRREIPEVRCEHEGCNKLLLYYAPSIDACARYLDHHMTKPASKQTMEASTLNVTSLLSPMMKPTLKKTASQARGAGYQFYNPSKFGNKTKPVYNKTGNSAHDIKDITSKKTVAENSYRVNEVRLAYALETEALAIEMCQALDVKNHIKQREIINKNKELIEKKRQAQLQSFQQAQGQLVEPVVEPVAEPVVEELAEEEVVITVDTLLAEYGDVDLETLSYEELTSKGLYNLENFCGLHNLSTTQCNTIELALVKYYGDEKSLESVPTVLRDSINENYKLIDGAPESMYAETGLIF